CAACFALGLLAAAWLTRGKDVPEPVAVAANSLVEQPAQEPRNPVNGDTAAAAPTEINASETNDGELEDRGAPEMVSANKPVVEPQADDSTEPPAPGPEAPQVAALPALPPDAPPDVVEEPAS